MKYVLDASVAIWVIPRPLTPKAVRLRNEYHRQIHELLAPTVFIDEVAGALTKAERQKDIAVGQAAPLYAKVMNSPPVLIPHAKGVWHVQSFHSIPWPPFGKSTVTA